MSAGRVLIDAAFPIQIARDALGGSGVQIERAALPWGGDDVLGVLAWSRVGAEDLNRMPALRVLATPSVGIDHVDVDAATRRGIWVCNVPDYCVDEMADSALALLLALVRGVVELDRSVRDGRWDDHAAGPLRRVADVRLGVIGLGRIGRALAARALALGIDVSATDPVVADETMVALGVTPALFDDLLANCNAVSLHAPLMPATQYLLGQRELDLLPFGSYVVNVSRAGLVDGRALLAALASGRLAGAALDVLSVEPPSPDAPAPRAPRLIVTPHAAWYSPEAEWAVYRRAAEAVRDALAGRRPQGSVNEVVATRSGAS